VVGGFLYEQFGWAGCARYHVVTAFAMFLIASTCPVSWQSFSEYRRLRFEEPTVVESVDKQDRKQKAVCTCTWLPRNIIYAGLALALAQGANVFAYQTEYATYAAFFLDVYQLHSPVLVGACQMAGDVLAAVFIVLAGKCSWRAPEESKSPQHFTALTVLGTLFRKPYHISWFLASWVPLCLGMSTNIYVAILCQVAMGSNYVFLTQFMSEMNLLYAFGDLGKFMKLQTTVNIIQALGSSGGIQTVLILYARRGPYAPFYAGAVVAACVTCLYTGYFFARVGLVHSLKEFESEWLKEGCSKGNVSQGADRASDVACKKDGPCSQRELTSDGVPRTDTTEADMSKNGGSPRIVSI